jgi:hypothetical protein
MSDTELNDLNDKKLNQMKVDILKVEQQNLKTREKSYDVMVEEINKIIVAEVNKSY